MRKTAADAFAAVNRDGSASAAWTRRLTTAMSMVAAASAPAGPLCGAPLCALCPVWQRWRWAPAGCSLPAWSGGAFCRALGVRQLLLVGDSTVAQALPAPRAATSRASARPPAGWRARQFATTLLSMVGAGGGACIGQLRFETSSTLRP